MKIDWLGKLSHLLQTVAFCLAVAAIQYAFAPERPYAPTVVFSVLIGLNTCVIIDFGRELMPSARETGWPTGMGGVGLVGGGMLAGWLLGNVLGIAACRAFGLFPPVYQGELAIELRNGLMVTLLAGTIATYWFYSRNQSNYLGQKMAEAQRHASEARLKLLETQLEPHMLFNTLANLRALIAVDPARAQEMLDHMIAYLRATLAASRGATHPLHTEFARLRDYLELMAIRMGPRLAYTLDLPAELADVPVPTLLLQPLVENSIRHGLEPKLEGGRIEVHARREGERLVIDVQDTGLGAAEPAAGGTGFGLAQIRERLTALHGNLASLQFESDAGGAHARIALPIA
jgi:signal transduction histidine kinase